ncbi:MAG: hypothetical protein ABIE84_04685 [bacterium]
MKVFRKGADKEVEEEILPKEMMAMNAIEASRAAMRPGQALYLKAFAKRRPTPTLSLSALSVHEGEEYSQAASPLEIHCRVPIFEQIDLSPANLQRLAAETLDKAIANRV